MAETKQDKKEKSRKAEADEAGGVAVADTNDGADAEQLKGYMPALKQKYREQIVPNMVKRFGYKNVNEVPRLQKIVVNMGVGEASRDAKVIDSAEKELATITGQKPKRTLAKKSISAFKLREGQPVGCFVTLRGNMMYEFMERLINVAIPRIRDFRGFPTRSFDGRGNHSLGIREHLIFMELDFNKVTAVKGMNITTVTTAKTDEEALELLRQFGFPFREK